MIRRATLALSSLLTLLGLSEQPVSAQEHEPAFRLGPVAALGDEPSYAELGVGVFDVFSFQGERATSAAANVQLRWGRKAWFIGPAIGLMANTDGGVFGYGGIYFDLTYNRVVFTPFFGPGGYVQGHSKDLGGAGPLQFRTELGVAYQFDGGARLGARIAHLSNAGIHHSNPGEEELLLTYALPFP
jgi:lipid A 3-O-deacylase